MQNSNLKVTEVVVWEPCIVRQKEVLNRKEPLMKIAVDSRSEKVSSLLKDVRRDDVKIGIPTLNYRHLATLVYFGEYSEQGIREDVRRRYGAGVDPKVEEFLPKGRYPFRLEVRKPREKVYRICSGKEEVYSSEACI